MGPKHILFLLVIKKMDAEKLPTYLPERLECIDFILRNVIMLILTFFARHHVFFPLNKYILTWVEYLLRKLLEFFNMGPIIAKVQIFIFLESF
jgi:hypothetical protein